MYKRIIGIFVGIVKLQSLESFLSFIMISQLSFFCLSFFVSLTHIMKVYLWLLLNKTRCFCCLEKSGLIGFSYYCLLLGQTLGNDRFWFRALGLNYHALVQKRALMGNYSGLGMLDLVWIDLEVVKFLKPFKEWIILIRHSIIFLSIETKSVLFPEWTFTLLQSSLLSLSFLESISVPSVLTSKILDLETD